mmetsp:Transcript_36913/g.75659  ORF Transcript_36913/g.75659 Transcript_36913/m.75659 type:complete len:246 (-) Transcript_36913:815-1552(-)
MRVVDGDEGGFQLVHCLAVSSVGPIFCARLLEEVVVPAFVLSLLVTPPAVAVHAALHPAEQPPSPPPPPVASSAARRRGVPWLGEGGDLDLGFHHGVDCGHGPDKGVAGPDSVELPKNALARVRVRLCGTADDEHEEEDEGQQLHPHPSLLRQGDAAEFHATPQSFLCHILLPQFVILELLHAALVPPLEPRALHLLRGLGQLDFQELLSSLQLLPFRISNPLPRRLLLRLDLRLQVCKTLRQLV